MALMLLTLSLAGILGCSGEPSASAASPGMLPDYALPADWDEQEKAALLREAAEKLGQGRAQEVVDSLQKVVSQSEVDPRVSLLYGQALFQVGNTALAVWPLARAAEEAAADSDAAFLYARALLTGGDPPTAIEELNRLIEQAPNDLRLIRLRSRAYQRSLDFENALVDLDTLIEMMPEEIAAVQARITVLIEMEDVERARVAIGELAELVERLDLPKSERAEYCASAALFEAKDNQRTRARKMFEACLAEFPDEPAVLFPWALFLDESGAPEEAIAVLEDSMTRNADKGASLHIALANRYAKAGRREDTARILNAAAEQFDDPGILFLLADHRMDWGDLEGAQEIADRAIEQRFGHAPGSPEFSWAALPAEGRFGFGDLLIRTGQDAEAEKLIASFDSDREGEEVYPLLLRARLRLEQHLPGEALELFEESFRYWPSNVGARYLAGRAAMELGKFDQGLSFYRDAFRAAPTGSDAGLVLGRLHAAEGHWVAAAETVSTLLGQNGDDPKALLFFSDVASRIGAFDSANATLGDLTRFRDYVGLAYRAASVSIADREGIPAAIAYLEETANFSDPVQYEAFSQWARFQRDAGRGDQARARIEEELARSERSAEFKLVLARFDQVAGESEKAVAAYQKAVELDPLFVNAWVELGMLRFARGELEQARAAFESALSLESGELRASIGLADIAFAAADIEEAKRLYRKTLGAHPWQGRAASALARIGFDRGDTGDQVLIWARWAARFGEDLRGPSAEMLGEILLKRGAVEDAVNAFQSAAQQSVSPTRSLYLLGRSLKELGQPKKAIVPLERALELGDFKNRAEAEDAQRILGTLREESRS